MAQRVSAETITEITSSPGFVPPGKVSTPPSPEDIIQTARKELDERIAKFTRILAGNPTEEDGRRARESLDKARFQRKQFDQLLNEVPEGFKLVPVYYSKITQDQNGAVHEEYLSNVRTRFLKFIGENHADAARALGVCEHGIERMKMGLDPADKEGRQYEMNIDHIIERAGSGLWAVGKEKDPDQKPEVEDKFRQNHFGNLILIPTKIHDYKNTLNGLQKIGTLQPGEGRWILMMTPERSEQNPAFICPPQTPGSRWDILSVKEKDPFNEIHHADFTVKQAADRLREFRTNPVVDKALQAIEEVARTYKRDVAQMANDNIKGRRSLSKIFNDVLEHDEAAREAEKLLAPALKEVANNLTKCFDGVADNLGGDKGNKLLHNFNGFFRSNAMRTLRENTAKLPMPEAKEIADICKTIEADLNMLIPPKPRSEERSAEGKPKGDARKNFNGQSARKPRNDNAAAPKQGGWKKKKKNKDKNKSNDRGSARKGGWHG
ncbi:MAG: hypothetical protein Q8K65_08015 [Alphaproteobacteria bacterium]|nr:hypothetical protein [Alphaproteobacteria bacterium]